MIPTNKDATKNNKMAKNEVEPTSHELTTAKENLERTKDDRPFPPRITTPLKDITDEDVEFTSKPKRRLKFFGMNRATSMCEFPTSGTGTYLSPSGKPLKSCMSVTTINESLKSCQDDKPEQKPNDDTETPDPPPIRMNRCSSMPDFQSKPKQNVCFGTVSIRTHGRVIGDNPSCIKGPPVSLDWKHKKEEHHCIDLYEQNRSGSKRTKAEFRLKPLERIDMLRAEGYSPTEIIRAERDKNITKNQRRSTVARLQSSKIEEMMEKASRKIKRIVTGKTKEQEQAELWEKAKERVAENKPDALQSSSKPMRHRTSSDVDLSATVRSTSYMRHRTSSDVDLSATVRSTSSMRHRISSDADLSATMRSTSSTIHRTSLDMDLNATRPKQKFSLYEYKGAITIDDGNDLDSTVRKEDGLDATLNSRLRLSNSIRDKNTTFGSTPMPFQVDSSDEDDDEDEEEKDIKLKSNKNDQNAIIESKTVSNMDMESSRQNEFEKENEEDDWAIGYELFF